MNSQRNRDALRGVTLEMVLTFLVEKFCWEELGYRVDVKDFTNDPSISSSLKFLRRMPLARAKVDALYVASRTEGSRASRLPE